jgi:ligand-binding sensor domain-containing protein/signal transduction histidine kinase
MAGNRLRAETAASNQVLAFHRWGHEDGLPNDTVTALLQTQDGYLWVGTAAGLARFDGVEFEPVPVPGENQNQFPAITSLCEDDAHRLWIGTRENGLYWLANGAAHHFIDSPNSGSESITSLAADGTNQLWVGTSAGLFRVRLDALRRAEPSLGFTNDFISSVHAARSGTIWITTRNGMSQYKNGGLTPVELDAENLGRTLEFIGLYEDRTGALWAFGDTYLVNLSEGKRFNYFRTGDASSFRIWTLCEGSSGQLWIGTSGQGLFAFSEGRFRPLALRENRLPSDVRAICEDRQGDLWLGTFGGGLIRLRVRREQIFDSAVGLPAETASCITVDGGGRLWAGFQDGGLFAATGRSFERVGGARLVSSLALAPDGSAWAGTRGDGLHRINGSQEIRFDTGSGLSSDTITAVAVAANGAVWIGSDAGTLQRLNGSLLETFDRRYGLSGAAISAISPGANLSVCAGTTAGEIFTQRLGGFRPLFPGSFAGSEITSLREDGSGALWIGSLGKGLGRVGKNKLSVWNTKTGLPDNDVYAVLAETNDVVWMAAARGVFRVNTANANGGAAGMVTARLVVESPAAEREPRGFPTAAKSGDGRLWFALPGHIVSIDPGKVDSGPASLPIYIGRVLANDVPIYKDAKSSVLRLPSGLTSLEIRFSALNLAEPEKVQFQHKLDGFDSDWVSGGTERRVRYGRLPYGNYTFHLRARNVDGLWTEANSPLAFEYPVPAWLSPVALSLYAVASVTAVALLVWAILHRRLQIKLERLGRQQAMERERMRIARDMHDEVGSKLTKIAYLSDILSLRIKGPEMENIRSIAGTSRDLLQSLDEIVWAVNPRNDSLERLAAYLGHFAVEYFQDTAIELEMDLPAGLPDHPLSAETRHNLFLAFEEALANALKHSGASRVQVSMRLAGSAFVITIGDNGRGFQRGATPTRNGGGNGLCNMQQRLQDVGGTFQLESTPGVGTKICLTLMLAAGKPKYA